MPRWLTWTISATAFLLIGRWVLNSAFALAGHPIDYADWFQETRDYGEMLLVAGIAAALVYYEGPKAAGFTGSLAMNVRASLHGTYVILALGMLAYMVFAYIMVGVAVSYHISPDNPILFGVPNEAPDTYHHILWSVHAGWVEEVIVVGLVFFLLKRTSWQIGGMPIWMTGWATAITIVIRLSYHTYHGLWIIPMIFTGWMFVRLYRATGSIVPLIVAHAAWDMFDLVADSPVQRVLFVLSLVVFVELITKGVSESSSFGFPRFPTVDKKWSGYYWASWRWDTTPPPAPQAAPQSAAPPEPQVAAVAPK